MAKEPKKPKKPRKAPKEKASKEKKASEDLIKETRSVLIDKILAAYQLKAADIADVVELYYDCQNLREMHANRQRTEGENDLTEWFYKWLHLGENVIKGKLQKWVESDDSPPETKWAYAQIGIGPVIAAGLAAHIDVKKAPTISSLWKFAGQAPGFDRKVKGTKLPYNAKLKNLVWKLEESFVKVSGKEGATYGRLYAEFKAEETRRNDEGRNAEAASLQLKTKRYSKPEAKKTLESGKLTDGHVHNRAKRRVAKIFLSHYWLKGREAGGLPVRKPYPIGVLGHDGEIAA
jgi:hypothetical protein